MCVCVCAGIICDLLAGGPNSDDADYANTHTYNMIMAAFDPLARRVLLVSACLCPGTVQQQQQKNTKYICDT